MAKHSVDLTKAQPELGGKVLGKNQKKKKQLQFMLLVMATKHPDSFKRGLDKSTEDMLINSLWS